MWGIGGGNRRQRTSPGQSALWEMSSHGLPRVFPHARLVYFRAHLATPAVGRHRWGCSHLSCTNSVTPPQPGIKEADRAKHGAHQERLGSGRRVRGVQCPRRIGQGPKPGSGGRRSTGGRPLTSSRVSRRSLNVSRGVFSRNARKPPVTSARLTRRGHVLSIGWLFRRPA